MIISNEPFLLIGQKSEAVLFLHGLGGGAYELRPLADHLHKSGFTVCGFNYPGHDHPHKRMPRSNWKQWYRKAKEIYAKLKRDYETIHLVGFSTGVPLGVYLAHDHPIGKFVALAPFYQIKYEWFYLLPPEIYAQTIGRLIEDVPRRKLPIANTLDLFEAEEACFFRTFNLPSVRSALELIRLSKSKLATIDRPVLILQSHKDQVVDPRGTEFFFQSLSSRDKTLIWLKDSDHVLTLDHEKELVYAKVEEFLLKGHDS